MAMRPTPINRILRIELMVDAHGKVHLALCLRSLEFISRKIQPIANTVVVWRRREPQELLNRRIQSPVRWIVCSDVVAGDRHDGIAAGIDRGSRCACGIVLRTAIRARVAARRLRDITEYPLTGQWSQNNACLGEILRRMQELRVHEEERLILDDGTAHAEAQDVLNKLRPANTVLFVSGIVRVQTGRLIKPEHVPMKCIRA